MQAMQGTSGFNHTLCSFRQPNWKKKNEVKFVLLSKNGPKHFEVNGKIFTDFQSSGSDPG